MPVFAERSSTAVKGQDVILLTTEWRHKDQVKTIPGTKWRSEIERWTAPLSWASCLALRTTFGHELQVGPELAAWAAAEKAGRVEPCLWLRDQLDRPGDPSLFGWQRSGIEFLLYAKRAILADCMGSGKTITAIRGLARLQQVHELGHPLGEPVFPILVVCPASVKKGWAREFEKWWPGLKVNVVSGSAARRRKLLEEKAHVYVMNFEAVKSHSRLSPYGSVALKRCPEHGGEDEKITAARCEVHEKELNRIDFRAVVVDEAHRISSGKASQTRAVKAAAGDAKVRLALTGTPQKNDVTDLWSILNFVAPDEYPGKSSWIDRYVETMLNAFGGMVVIGVRPQMKAEFEQLLDSRMRRMQEDIVLAHLPPIVYERRDIEMSAKQAKAYKEMKKGLEAEFEAEDGTVATLDADSPMTKATRLIQLASSYGEVEETETVDEHGFPAVKKRLVLTDPSSKLDSFMEEVEDFGDHSVAVMTVSRQLLMLLSERLTKKGVRHGIIAGGVSEEDRQRAIDDFQAGKTKFILFTSAAGGTGVTLTAARYLVRLQLPYSLVDYEQSLRRVRRIGSEIHDSIIVIDYTTQDTLDAEVFDALVVKQQSFEEVIRDGESLRRILAQKPPKEPE